MNKFPGFEAGRHARRVSEQAASWYLNQHDEPSERQQAAFLTWLHASPTHVAEYLAIAQMHGDLKAAASMETLTTAELVERARHENAVVMFPHIVADMSAKDEPHTGEALRTQARRKRHMFARIAATAALVVMALLGGVYWELAGKEIHQSYAAGPDAVREVRLPDGSLVQLAPNGIIDTRFDRHYRRIEVIRGNALFDVGKDPARPMLVNVGGHVLQDIGTVFDVNRDASGDMLTVISGRVRVWNVPQSGADKVLFDKIRGDVSAPQKSSGAVADLTAGEQIQLKASAVGAIQTAAIAQITSWLPDDIRFQHEMVGDVARRFNAYTSTPLVIEDPRIADMRISGVFHANNPQAFIAYLLTIPGVRVMHDRDCVRIVASQTHGIAKTERL
ncbi:MAG: FecR domain-containing protein [Rhodanobacter sp.]